MEQTGSDEIVEIKIFGRFSKYFSHNALESLIIFDQNSDAIQLNNYFIEIIENSNFHNKFQLLVKYRGKAYIRFTSLEHCYFLRTQARIYQDKISNKDFYPYLKMINYTCENYKGLAYYQKQEEALEEKDLLALEYETTKETFDNKFANNITISKELVSFLDNSLINYKDTIMDNKMIAVSDHAAMNSFDNLGQPKVLKLKKTKKTKKSKKKKSIHIGKFTVIKAKRVFNFEN